MDLNDKREVEDESARLLGQERMRAAVARIRERAKELGLDKLTDEEIQAEIQAHGKRASADTRLYRRLHPHAARYRSGSWWQL